MEKFIPFKKLSKKMQRKINLEKRGTWGSLNPVTRTPDNPRAYKRQNMKKESREDG